MRIGDGARDLSSYIYVKFVQLLDLEAYENAFIGEWILLVVERIRIWWKIDV